MSDLWPIHILSDNYVWVISDPTSGVAAVVDPGEAAPVIAALHDRDLRLGWVLLTHHHADHVAGLAALTCACPAPVLGPPGVRGVTRVVRDGETIELGELGLELEVAHVPGHTASHLAFLGPGLALVGDTLFTAGCGRLFEGTAAQLLASLDRLAALPPATSIYCAHEYTEENLDFVRLVEPDSPAVVGRIDETRRLRAAGQPTVPSTLALELATNPFLRSREPAVVAAAEAWAGHRLGPGLPTFAVLRAWRDEV